MKKISIRDGWQAIYCVLKYNLHKAPWLIQFLFYLGIGGLATLVNLAVFLMLHRIGAGLNYSTPIAFVLAAAVNYYLSIAILFRHNARWNSITEISMFLILVCTMGYIDLYITSVLLAADFSTTWAKLSSSAVGLPLNFAGRRWLVFSEPPNPETWKHQENPSGSV